MQLGSEAEWRTRAEENERLRRLLADELAHTRDELSEATSDATGIRSELLALNSRTRDVISTLAAENESLKEQLASARRDAMDAQEIIRRQTQHIARLKRQVERPFRTIAKKVLRKSPRPTTGGRS